MMNFAKRQIMNLLVEKSTYDEIVRKNLEIMHVNFGSAARNEATADSDTDTLMFIRRSDVWAQSPFYTHHLLQYKDVESNRDIIICTVQSFVKGLIDGDSTVFIEILRNGWLEHTELTYLHRNMKMFSTYRMARALIGTAERDIKECTKLFSKDPRKSTKKYKFAIDGLKMAIEVMQERWPSAAIDAADYIPDVSVSRSDTYTTASSDCTTIANKLALLRRDLNSLNENDQRNKVEWFNSSFANDLVCWTAQSEFCTAQDIATDIITTRACNFE